MQILFTTLSRCFIVHFKLMFLPAVLHPCNKDISVVGEVVGVGLPEQDMRQPGLYSFHGVNYMQETACGETCSHCENTFRRGSTAHCLLL